MVRRVEMERKLGSDVWEGLEGEVGREMRQIRRGTAKVYQTKRIKKA